jgi:hypothetical protein
LDSFYRTVGQGVPTTIYEAFLRSPLGLSFIFPPRWLVSLPNWARIPVAGSTAWQWLGLAAGSMTGGLIIWIGHRAARRRDDGENAGGARWRALLLPLAILFVAGIVAPFLDMVLRIGGTVRIVLEYARTGAMYLSAAWLSVAFSAVLGEAVVGSERLTMRSPTIS